MEYINKNEDLIINLIMNDLNNYQISIHQIANFSGKIYTTDSLVYIDISNKVTNNANDMYYRCYINKEDLKKLSDGIITIEYSYCLKNGKEITENVSEKLVTDKYLFINKK